MLFSQFRNLVRKPFAGRRPAAAVRATSRRKAAGAIHSAVESLEGRALFSYAPAIPYTGVVSPVAVATADFNNDGRSDVVVTDSMTSSANVLLGNGDGTFQAPQSTALGAIPGSRYSGSQAGTIATADFNADGRLDLAVVSTNTGVILLGNGDGTFQAPQTTVLGTSVTRISTGDVNNDGRADLLAANSLGTASVLIGNGDGTFAPRVDLAAGPDAMDIKSADLDHDGNADLIVANQVSTGTITVLKGHGDGSFDAPKSYYAFSGPFRIVVDDFNGDGNDDVAVANSYSSSYVSIIPGNGDGSFGTCATYDTGSQPWEIEAEDVDGDGKHDLISSNGTSYQVELNNGDGTLAPVTSFTGSGRDFVAEDFNHDGTADLVGAGAGSVGVMINNAVSQTNVSTAVGFRVSAAATTAAGAPTALTISPVDVDGNVVTDFLGIVHVTSSDRRMGGRTITFTAADAGSVTLTPGVTMYTLGAQTITAAGPAQLTGTGTITVTAGAVSRFVVTAAATATAGSPASFTVAATDAYGNLTSDYAGTVHFTSNDVLAGLPADYTFTADDAGSHTFTAALKTAGLRSVTATDTATLTVKGTSPWIVVTASAVSSIGITGGGGHIGSPHVATVTAYDAYGNVATGYAGTIHLSASDAGMVLPGDAMMSNGVATFSVTPMTLGAQTLTATDTSGAGLTVTQTITGTPGDAVRFTVTPIGNAVAGTVQTFTVTAYDAFGNVAVDYGGTVVFSSTDPIASLPYYTFAAADGGTHTFTVALKTAGTQSLTVRDSLNTSMTSTQTGIVVTPAAAVSLNVGRLRAGVAGVAQSITISARDVYGNVAPDYRGTLTFSSTDALAALPAAYTFTAADAGAHVFSVTLKSAGGNDVTVQDTVNPAMASFQGDIQVTPAAFARFSFKAPSNVTVGVAFNVTLTAVDAFGNTVTGYTGKVRLTGPSGSGNLLPPDYAFTGADAGAHTFSVTLSPEGNATLSVLDLVDGIVKGSTQVTVKKASGGGGGGGGGGGSGGGGGKRP
jgi:hypothetical protein